MEQTLKNKILEVLSSEWKKLGLKLKDVEITKPNHEDHGEYSSNIAMRMVKELKRSPLDIANAIVGNLGEIDGVESIEAVAPGFINFKLDNLYYSRVLKGIDEKYGESDLLKGKKVMVEYTDPNPFKVLHIGHLFTNMIGESLARLFESAGAEVKRANYQGDVGLHVAKTMWGLEEKLGEEKMVWDDVAKLELADRVAYLGQAYAMGNNAYEDDKGAVEAMKDLNYYVFIAAQDELAEEILSDYRKYVDVNEDKLAYIKKVYIEGRQWCLDYFEIIYDRVGTKFDFYFFESIVGEFGMKMVMDNLGKVFKEDAEAIIFKGKDYGLHTRVFVNKLGLPTYEAKDLGLAVYKSEKYDADLSVIITAEEQASYFQVMLKALEQIKPDVANNTLHLAHGMVKLPGAQKMSSRTGSILGAEWLLDEVRGKIVAKMKESENSDKVNIENVSDVLSVAAVKYAFLRSALGKDVVFDFDEATQFDGDTGPYIMYAYTRCKSILKSIKNSEGQLGNFKFDEAESRVMRLLNYFPEEVAFAVANNAPSRIVGYLFDLAQAFNNFYQVHSVKDSKGDEQIKRLKMVKAVSIVLQKGLHLIGVQTVEKM